MAFKLSKTQQDERDNLVKQLNEAATILSAQVAAFNEKLEELKTPVDEAYKEYCEILERVTEFVNCVASEASDAFDERSEKWQEGEKGQAASDWKDEWEGISFDEPQLNLPDPVDDPAPDHASELEALPSSADGD